MVIQVSVHEEVIPALPRLNDPARKVRSRHERLMAPEERPPLLTCLRITRCTPHTHDLPSPEVRSYLTPELSCSRALIMSASERSEPAQLLSVGCQLQRYVRPAPHRPLHAL